MEGLLPLLYHAIKKRRSKHKHRCFSESNSKSSYRLLGCGHDLTLEGLSHCQKGSEFQPLVTAELSEQRSALDFNHSCSYEEEDGVSAGVPFVRSSSKDMFLSM
ncbi:hypothetical protein RchiOBHm_Chr6g0253731 [Rosa chinensis]|uniref:Uncharacterized protein n=1 Tax=Rosa chinensis TaxID=74649 RepID=A0A2P6PLE1_ROSCH|nr:hypothetical protein RchiOBHm_Chr6g0253731 [Rosa chinensis]